MRQFSRTPTQCKHQNGSERCTKPPTEWNSQATSEQQDENKVDKCSLTAMNGSTQITTQTTAIQHSLDRHTNSLETNQAHKPTLKLSETLQGTVEAHFTQM